MNQISKIIKLQVGVRGLVLYHVAIPTDVSLLSLAGGKSRAAGLQRMTRLVNVFSITFGNLTIIQTPIYSWAVKNFS